MQEAVEQAINRTDEKKEKEKQELLSRMRALEAHADKVMISNLCTHTLSHTILCPPRSHARRPTPCFVFRVYLFFLQIVLVFSSDFLRPMSYTQNSCPLHANCMPNTRL